MTDPQDPFEPLNARPAVAAAAHSFVRALMGEALLAHVDRVETLLIAGDADLALSADRLVADAWPTSATPPRHEVIWTWRQGPLDGVALAAFDLEGRPLLRRHYSVDPTGAVAAA